MSLESRLTGLERRLPSDEEPFQFTFCKAPTKLSAAAHAEYHRARGEPHCFTLDLGAAAVRQGDDE